jgi:hypothetical protein
VAPSSIDIHHLDLQYTIPRQQSDVSSVQRRLDHIAHDLLARAWDSHLAEMHDSDDRIYFIERLEVDLSLDMSQGDDHAVAKVWAVALHQAIWRALSRRDHHVITFATRGEFMACFLEALLHGKAWDEWYYREFTSLRPLALNQAIVTVLTADGDAGRDALLALTRRGELDRLLTALTDADVDAVVSQCLMPPSPSVSLPNTISEWVRSLRALVERQRSLLTTVLSRDLARLYLFLLRDRPELGPDVHLARFIWDVLQLRQSLAQLSSTRDVITMVESEAWHTVLRQSARRQTVIPPEGAVEPTALQQLHRGREGQFLAMLMREVGGPEVAALLRQLHVETPHAVPDRDRGAQRISTPYGGIFLLAPSIVEMGLDDFLVSCPYPEPKGMSKVQLSLFVIALQCLGGQNAVQALGDKGIALFAGLDAPPTTSQLEQYAQALRPEMHTAFAQAFRAYQHEQINRPGVFGWLRTVLTAPPDDFEWFSLASEPLMPNRAWHVTFSPVSSTVLGWFALKLGAFANSSPEYLCQNFLASHATIEVSAAGMAVHFLTSPLQVVLRMVGFDENTWQIPWLANRVLQFSFA